MLAGVVVGRPAGFWANEAAVFERCSGGLEEDAPGDRKEEFFISDGGLPLGDAVTGGIGKSSSDSASNDTTPRKGERCSAGLRMGLRSLSAMMSC